jgi:hypothetical protein
MCMFYYEVKYGVICICKCIIHLQCFLSDQSCEIFIELLSSFFPPMFNISIIWSVVLYVCPVSSMCCANYEFCLFVLMTCMCSLYQTLSVCPICPLYLNGDL